METSKLWSGQDSQRQGKLHQATQTHFEEVSNALCILNKITPTNFNKLVPQFTNLLLGKKKKDTISKVARLLVKKATHELLYTSLYARLANVVRILLYKTSIGASRIFREQLLYESKSQLKFFMGFGNVRFIGELYEVQMLTPKFMMDCVNVLLVDTLDKTVERLCELLTTIGHGLEIYLQSVDKNIKRENDGKLEKQNWLEKIKQRNELNRKDKMKRGYKLHRWRKLREYKPKLNLNRGCMDKIFFLIKTLRKVREYSPRMHFKCLDVIQLRKRDWKPRMNKVKDGPEVIQRERIVCQDPKLKNIYDSDNKVLLATEYKLAVMTLYSLSIRGLDNDMEGKFMLLGHIHESYETMQDVLINECIRSRLN